MELSDFVAKSLIEIETGLVIASRETNRGFQLEQEKGVLFEVQVYITETDTNTLNSSSNIGGTGSFVAGGKILVAKGEISGNASLARKKEKSLESQKEQHSISSIKFYISPSAFTNQNSNQERIQDQQALIQRKEKDLLPQNREKS